MSKDKSQKKKVIIKWRAYVTMMKHVLRFGSNAKDKSQFREVMGILMGRLADEPGVIKDVIIEDAVPISHGGHIEVAFKPEDYVSFSVVDSQYGEKGIFAVGWYHSHPGLTCFFSAVDIRNQLGWQTSQNPSAIGIVWDHQRLVDMNDMGFDVYRLDDITKGPMSDYHEVPWVLEPPEDNNFYREGIVDLISSFYKGEPPILELNEVPDVFGDLEVPGTSSMMAKEPELEYTKVVDALKGGIDKMADVFINPLIRYLNEWAQDISKGIINKNVVMLTNIRGLKDNLSKAMANLQSWFKFALNDQLRDVDIYIDDKFEFNGEQRKKITEQLNTIADSLNDNISKALDQAIAKIIEDIGKKLGDAVGNLKKLSEDTENISNTMISQKTALQSGMDTFNSEIVNLKKLGEESLKSSKESLKKGLSPATEQIDKLQQELDDIKLGLKAIIGMVKGGN